MFTSSSLQGRAIIGASFVAQFGRAIKEGELATEVEIIPVAAARAGSGCINDFQNVSFA